MKDEIKEKKTKRIIEKIEGLATYVTIPRELAIYNVNIDSQEAKLLLDYITNLQQINNSLTTSLNKKIEEGINLQQNYERLKKLEYKFIDTCGENESFTLEEYLDIGNKLYDSEREKEDYKSRCKKAIEYIKEHTTSFGDVFIPASESWYLSDILNGRSDE